MLVRCASAPTSPSSRIERDPSIAEYAQLVPGSARTYAVQFPGQKGEMTVRVTGRDEEGWIVDDRGGKFRLTNEGLRDSQRYLIRAPLESGATWKSILSASAVENYRIVDVGSPCEVRAGRFPDCLVIESTLRRDRRMQLVARWTWIRGVGLGRVETTAQVDGRPVPQTRQDLVHFDRGGPASTSGTSTPVEQASDWGR